MQDCVCQWIYEGGYDAVTTLRVLRGGVVLSQRGTYHSHPERRLQGDWPRLQAWLRALDEVPEVAQAALPSTDFMSTFSWAAGREIRWQGKIPDAPAPLRALVDYLDHLD